MGSINFDLKKANTKDDCLIMLTYQSKGKRFRYSTKQKIKEKVWKEKEQRVKSQAMGANEINTILDDLENILKEIEREAVFNKKEYSIEVIKKKFSLKQGELSPGGDFFKVYEQFIEANKPSKSVATIQTYEATKVKLEEFAVAKKLSVTFENINNQFYENFLNYLIKDLNLLNNTVGKHIKTLKVFLNYATEKELTNQAFNLKKFKVFREDSDIVYLTDKELMKLYHLEDLPKHLQNVRDNFCFSCFTGLRFSDISKLSKGNIKENYIEIKAEKTKDFLKIPLNDFAKEILAKRTNSDDNRPLPTGISNQKTNEYLKLIGKAAEIDEVIEIEKFNGSKKVIIKKPKYDLLSSHTGRRTFVTLALEKGIRAEVVMAMTGHKNYKTFKKYIKITDKVMENEMKNMWSKEAKLHIA